MNARLAGRTGNNGKHEVSFPSFQYSIADFQFVILLFCPQYFILQLN